LDAPLSLKLAIPSNKGINHMDDPLDLERDAAMVEFIENSLDEIAQDSVRSYLGTYGDAVEERVRQCVVEAKKLIELDFWGPSLTLSVTAIEIIIRFMILRPLVQGAFLSEEWAEILSKRIATGRSAEDRKLLPAILKQWGIEITTIKIESNEPLWENIQMLIQKRNDFVHSGEAIQKHDAIKGLEAADTLIKKIIFPVAEKLGFTLTETGKWHKIDRYTSEGGEYHTSFSPLSPFEK
jgi:hypothetical protein